MELTIRALNKNLDLKARCKVHSERKREREREFRGQLELHFGAILVNPLMVWDCRSGRCALTEISPLVLRSVWSVSDGRAVMPHAVQ